jgi:glycosyltransferase involved in cell wall biosynthesis
VFGTDFGGWGGGEQGLLEHTVGLRVRGWRVFLFAPTGELCNRAQACGIPTRNWRDLDRPGLHAAMLEVSPDLCHLVSYDKMTRSLARLAHREGLPYIITVSALGFPGGVRSRLFVRRAAAVITASDTVQRQLRGTRVRARRVESMLPISEGSLSHSPSRRAFEDREDNEVIVGWVGRLDPVKRLEDAIAAFAAFREVAPYAKLRVAADTSSYASISAKAYAERVRQTIEVFGVDDAVVLEGKVDDVFAFLDNVDIFLLSSERETFSRVTFEAMITARPIVATRAAAVTDLIRNGMEGLLVNVGNIADMAAGLATMSTQRSMALRLGAAARDRALLLSDQHKPIDRLEQLYASALERAPIDDETDHIRRGKRGDNPRFF